MNENSENRTNEVRSAYSIAQDIICRNQQIQSKKSSSAHEYSNEQKESPELMLKAEMEKTILMCRLITSTKKPDFTQVFNNQTPHYV